MAPNLPPSITVNRNLASSIREYVKKNGGQNINETQMNQILQRVAKFDAQRDKDGGQSIFEGGNKYFGGGANDFRVQQGQQIQLTVAEFNEIFAGFLSPLETQKEAPEVDDVPIAPQVETKKDPEVQEKKDAETPVSTAPKLEVSKEALSESVLDAVDGKTLEREVNGKKQKISVATVDGEKVRRLINEDGSLGETLVLISSAGKNKYITQSEMDKRITTIFPEGLPEGVKADFVNMGGTPQIVFKKDGKVLDRAQVKELAGNQIANIKNKEAYADFNTKLTSTNEADITNAESIAKGMLDKINNEHGDKAGNVTFEEYLNSEVADMVEALIASDPELKAMYEQDTKAFNEQIKQSMLDVAQVRFNSMDASLDGELTAQEIKEYLENVDKGGNKDGKVTAQEMTSFDSVGKFVNEFVAYPKENNDVKPQNTEIKVSTEELQACLERGGMDAVESYIRGNYGEFNGFDDAKNKSIGIVEGVGTFTLQDGKISFTPQSHVMVASRDEHVTDHPPVYYNEAVFAQNHGPAPVTDHPPVYYNETVGNDENSPVNQRQVNTKGVTGSYSITESENGSGFSLKSDISVSMLSRKDLTTLFSPKNGLLGFDKTEEGQYTFRGLKSSNPNILNMMLQNMAQQVAINQAIYNDLHSKQESGQELTSAEQNFVKQYFSMLDNLGIKQDENGNLIEK